MVPKLASWADIAIEGGAADLKFLTEIRYVGLPGGHGGLRQADLVLGEYFGLRDDGYEFTPQLVP